MPAPGQHDLVVGPFSLAISLAPSSITVEAPRYTVDENSSPRSVAMVPVDARTGEPVDPSRLVRVATVRGDHLTLTDTDMAQVFEAGRLTVDQFLPLDLLRDGTYLPMRAYSVAPYRPNGRPGGSTRASQRGLSALFAAMAKEGVFALTSFLLVDGLPRYAALTPTGQLFALHFAEETSTHEPLTPGDVDPDEFMMMRALVAVRTNMSAPALSTSALADRLVSPPVWESRPPRPGSPEQFVATLRDAVVGVGYRPSARPAIEELPRRRSRVTFEVTEGDLVSSPTWVPNTHVDATESSNPGTLGSNWIVLDPGQVVTPSEIWPTGVAAYNSAGQCTCSICVANRARAAAPF